MTPDATTSAALARLLRRDRALVLVALVMTVILAWAYILRGAGMEMAMTTGEVAAPAAWTPGYAALMLAMWAVMMVAMMLPSAAPMILLFATISRKHGEGARSPYRATSVFALAYAVVWLGFSVAATGLQGGLERAALLTPAMATGSTMLASLLFIAAGVYQLTPWKQACLRRCRSPLEFLASRWRTGVWGAFRMGLEHGLFCVGCCWALMGLLFVGGLMNVLWIAVLALIVLVEKTLPAGRWSGRGVGVGLIVWGAWTLSAAPH